MDRAISMDVADRKMYEKSTPGCFSFRIMHLRICIYTKTTPSPFLRNIIYKQPFTSVESGILET